MTEHQGVLELSGSEKMDTRLWYKQPANYFKWTEALPVGNGRMGAMVFGGIEKDRIQLSEESLWSGGFRDRTNPNAKKELDRIRRLLRENKIQEAEELIRYSLSGLPEFQRTFQTLGDVLIETNNLSDDVVEYERMLSLEDAVAVTTFKAGGYRYKREVIGSNPADVIAVHLSTDNPDGLSFDARIIRNRFCEHSGNIDGNKVFVNGINGGVDGISFNTLMAGQSVGGKQEIMGEYLIFRSVKEATLYITAATSFRTKDTLEMCKDILDKALEVGYQSIRRDHIEDYQKLEKRVVFNLEGDDINLPTDQRLKRVQEGESDPKLMALYFRYGRYLLISSSRTGNLPANLQGVWCDEFLPAWDSKYTININAQMNYWPAEVANLSECHEPLIGLIRRMHPNGVETAKNMYGARGFTAHHNTDLWGDTTPQDTWLGSSYWVMGAAWLCLHIWEHYEYTLDKDFLRENYDLLRDACLFFEDFLIENDSGELVASPTVSPENTFVLDNGKPATVCEGCIMDAQILRELFYAFEESSGILEIQDDFVKTIGLMKAKLPKTKIGKNGGIMEWLTEQVEYEPGHRHISHLFGLFPGNEISPEETPELAKAARRTLELRLAHGGGHTGWSRAWIINFWARLGDGEEAYFHLNELLIHSTLPNLFDDHPPFQIDGNFGATAAIAHMLVQSTNNTVTLLKALPKAWKSGTIKGLCAKGGLVIDLEWENGLAKKVRMYAKNDYRGIIIYGGREDEITLKRGEEIEVDYRQE